MITPAYSGLVNSETGAVMTTVPTCTTTYTVTSNYGTSPTTSCSGGVAANYTFSYSGGLITIQKKTVTVTASSPTVTYGANVPAISPSYSGWRNSQTESTSGVMDSLAIRIIPPRWGSRPFT